MRNNLRLTVFIAVPLVLALVLGQLYFSFCQLHEYKSEEFLMDTLVSISTYGTDTDLLQHATREAFAEMRRLHELTDRFPQKDSPEYKLSDVGKINEMAGMQPVKVDEDVFKMLQAAQEYNVITEGAFDITIGPLMDLWGFGRQEQRVPDPQELQRALSLVDARKLILDKDSCTAFLPQKGMSLDLGAVAKGYAVEKAASILQKYGIKRALINAGGNIRVLGQKEGRNPWKVGIQDPRNSSALVGTLALEDESAVTSGDYNRTFTINGKQYHHIISPLTGYPARDNISVTVVTRDAFRGDLLSTALFLLESHKALKLAEELPDTEAFIITSQKEILLTSGLQNKVEVKPGEGYIYDKD